MQKFFPRCKLVHKFKRTIYYPISKPDEKASVPWRFLQLPSSDTEPRIQVGVYHKWTALVPPNPILMLHGLLGSHKTFASLIRHANYPWGIIAPDLRGYGGSEKAVPT